MLFRQLLADRIVLLCQLFTDTGVLVRQLIADRIVLLRELRIRNLFGRGRLMTTVLVEPS